ncbi:MAG: phosphate acyltransferase PlsX [Candidatus Acetothermia bacterium]
MKLLLDTISGDAPAEEIIQGAIEALNLRKEADFQIVLVGDASRNQAICQREGCTDSRVSFLNAPQRISMEDPPVSAVRSNPQSSLVQGCRALKDSSGAFITPGNTGAAVAASLLELGRLTGVARPGLAAVIPTVHRQQVIVMDVGATIDATSTNLVQFAAMASVLGQEILSKSSPAVGLLNIGEEESKGNKLIKDTRPLLNDLEINYQGNIEPHQILIDPPVDIAVCEGFVGNILLKAFEGGADGTINFFKQALSSSLRARIGGLLLKPALQDLQDQLSFSNFGAAPLLGVKGTVFVGHGRSDSRAIRNALLQAEDAVNWDLSGKIQQVINSLNNQGGS